MKVIVEPAFWVALVAGLVFAYWAMAYIRAANRVAEWIDANDRDLWVRVIWTKWGQQNSRYFNRIASRLESLVLFGGAFDLPSDAEFRARLSDARWAAFFCFIFWTLGIVAVGVLFHILGI